MIGTRAAAACAIVCLLSSGCTSLMPDEDEAIKVARAAHAVDQPDSACAELAPDVVSELESSSKKPCAQALPEEVGSPAGEVRSAWAEGQTAQVVFEDDVVFLAIFDGAWKVTAMGCSPRRDRPYECAVKGS